MTGPAVEGGGSVQRGAHECEWVEERFGIGEGAVLV
jgi:hypothetical protein